MMPPPRLTDSGPLGRLLAFVASVILLTVGLVFSLVVLAVIAAIGLMAWAYFWWKTRKLRKAMQEQPAGGIVIDGEAIVVEDAESEPGERGVDPRDPRRP